MSRPVRGTERAVWIAIPIVLVGILVVFLGVGQPGADPARPRADRRGRRPRRPVIRSRPSAAATSGSWAGTRTSTPTAIRRPTSRPIRPGSSRSCPLRLLLSEQPATGAPQAALEAIGLRLAAPTGEPFPPRPRPEGWHLMMEPLVVTGHFGDPAAADCRPAIGDSLSRHVRGQRGRRTRALRASPDLGGRRKIFDGPPRSGGETTAEETRWTFRRSWSASSPSPSGRGSC